MRSSFFSLSLALLVALAGCSRTVDEGDSAGSSDTSGGDTSGGTGGDATPDTAEPDADALEDVSDALDDALDAADTDAADTDADALDTSDTPDGTDTLDVAPDGTVEPDILPEPDVEAPFDNCSEPDGPLNIYDIQDPKCPDHFDPEPTSQPGVYVTLQGVVVTAVFSDTFFVQEQAGGPYSGIAVFDGGKSTAGLAPGVVIEVRGYYVEFYGSTQIYLDEWTAMGQVEPPAPYAIDHPAYVATGGALAEMFEGVLIRVFDLETIHTLPDCPQDYGEFLVTGGLRIDDMGIQWDARLGDEFASITGPLHFTFANHKIEPRDVADLAWTVQGGATSISKCIAEECSAPDDMVGTKQVVISEIMADPYGPDDGQEWIELYNPGDEPVDMTGWEVRDCGDQALGLVGKNVVVPAKGVLVLGMNDNPVTNGGVPVDHAYGDGFYLPNTEGSVLIYDGSGFKANLVDQARFRNFGPGWVQVFQVGHSIERAGLDSKGTSPESWIMGEEPFGFGDNRGTPGDPNTLAD
jgi:hypothetical protein